MLAAWHVQILPANTHQVHQVQPQGQTSASVPCPTGRLVSPANGLQTLWAATNHQSLRVASASCQAVVELVAGGRLAYEQAVDGFLMVIPSLGNG